MSSHAAASTLQSKRFESELSGQRGEDKAELRDVCGLPLRGLDRRRRPWRVGVLLRRLDDRRRPRREGVDNVGRRRGPPRRLASRQGSLMPGVGGRRLLPRVEALDEVGSAEHTRLAPG